MGETQPRYKVRSPRLIHRTPPYAEVLKERDELRAILAPLLDEPMRWMGSERDVCCVFCDTSPHLDDCPVLAKDRLLGREPA